MINFGVYLLILIYHFYLFDILIELNPNARPYQWNKLVGLPRGLFMEY